VERMGEGLGGAATQLIRLAQFGYEKRLKQIPWPLSLPLPASGER
jgi:hypothetical protein